MVLQAMSEFVSNFPAPIFRPYWQRIVTAVIPCFVDDLVNNEEQSVCGHGAILYADIQEWGLEQPGRITVFSPVHTLDRNWRNQS